MQINCINCNNIHKTTLNCNLTRNFTYLDYLNTVEILKKNKLIGIIISVNKVILPDELSSYFINLSETLDIIEAIELLKKIINSLFQDIRNYIAIQINKILHLWTIKMLKCLYNFINFS